MNDVLLLLRLLLAQRLQLFPLALLLGFPRGFLLLRQLLLVLHTRNKPSVKPTYGHPLGGMQPGYKPCKLATNRFDIQKP